MTLSGIRNFVQERRQVSLDEVARYFGMDPASVEPLLEHWVMKGRVRRKQGDAFSSACCGKCGGKRHTWYQWIG